MSQQDKLSRECTECGEFHHPIERCRTGEEILASYAPPADWWAKERARRAAAQDAFDDRFRTPRG